MTLCLLPSFGITTDLTPLFSGALVAQQKGHPVEDRQAQNALQQFVKFLWLRHVGREILCHWQSCPIILVLNITNAEKRKDQ